MYQHPRNTTQRRDRWVLFIRGGKLQKSFPLLSYDILEYVSQSQWLVTMGLEEKYRLQGGETSRYKDRQIKY